MHFFRPPMVDILRLVAAVIIGGLNFRICTLRWTVVMFVGELVIICKIEGEISRIYLPLQFQSVSIPIVEPLKEYSEKCITNLNQSYLGQVCYILLWWTGLWYLWAAIHEQMMLAWAFLTFCRCLCSLAKPSSSNLSLTPISRSSAFSSLSAGLSKAPSNSEAVIPASCWSGLRFPHLHYWIHHWRDDEDSPDQPCLGGWHLWLDLDHMSTVDTGFRRKKLVIDTYEDQ